jgi:hypothetical protein
LFKHFASAARKRFPDEGLVHNSERARTVTFIFSIFIIPHWFGSRMGFFRLLDCGSWHRGLYSRESRYHATDICPRKRNEVHEEIAEESEEIKSTVKGRYIGLKKRSDEVQ